MDVDTLIAQATAAISKSYFQLPVAGAEDPIYRERVYCYELYHQLRTVWPKDTDYVLGGEVDKAGHLLVRGNDLDRVKPDFLIHVPGNMGGNHAVIEVKPVVCSKDGVAKDLLTLTAFRRHAEYERAIFLIYGDGDVPKLVEWAEEIEFNDRGNRVALSTIEIWWHRKVGEPASRFR